MADTGWLIAGAGSDLAEGGIEPWTSPSSVTADDATYTGNTVTGISLGYMLYASSFGVSLPAGATVDGIEVLIDRSVNWSAAGSAIVYLTKTGASSSFTTYGALITNGFTTEVYGGPTEKWSTTWTKSEVEASSFGVGVQIGRDDLGSDTLSIDYISVKVHYTGSAGPTPTYYLPARRRGR